MNSALIGFGGGLAAGLMVWLTWKIARRGHGRFDKSGPTTVNRETIITSMRAVGELSVFRIMTKEVITASDHWLGEFGKKYLNWLLSSQRITLVIEFDVDFRYDLTDPRFAISPDPDGGFRFTLPPCRHEVLIRDMRIHSEDKTELLPWLMPDLLGRFITGGFSVDAKNKLISETRQQARGLASDLVNKTGAEAQKSAARTLTMLAQGLGADQVDIEFLTEQEFAPKVDISRIEGMLRGNSPGWDKGADS